MTESFYQSPAVPKETLVQLMRRDNHPAMIRFVILYASFIACCYWIVQSWSGPWMNLLLAQLTFALLGCSMFACGHETTHNTAFKSRKLNQLAAFLAGLAHLYPSILFRELHFAHHRYTHIPGKDPEISLGDKPGPSIISNLPMYLSWMSGLPLFLFKIMMVIVASLGMPEPLRKRLYPFVNPKVRLKLAAESLFVLACYVWVVILALQVNSGFWGIITGQALAHCFLTCFVTAEHNGLPHEGNIMDKTRSTKTNSLVKLMMWNMPYHAEHHAYPAIPFFSLPKLHAELSHEVKHQADGYPRVHLGILRNFFK
jgi:fatty acid desaturase